jgi:hypothetical protein
MRHFGHRIRAGLNCLAEGSYATNAWYARDPAGRRISYFQKRLMTCWSDPSWAAEVERHAERAIAAGAQGVFFDNIWMGATPWMLGGQVGGFAGCCCARCCSELATEVPARLHENGAAAEYLAWRARRVRSRVQQWAEHVRSVNPEAVVLLNNCDIILRDTRSLFGLDPKELASLQDALLIENVAVPRWASGRLVTNALTIKAVRALIPDAQPLTVTYQHGIGLDGPSDARVVSRTMAEAAALGAASVLKGSEYLDDEGRFTVLTAPALDQARAAAGRMFKWLANHTALYEDTTHDPAVLILLDEDALRDRWAETAPGLAAAAIAVQSARLSYGFVTCADVARLAPATLLVVPPGTTAPRVPGLETVTLPKLDVPGVSSALLRSRALRSAAHPLLTAVARGYFGNARVRRAFDALGISRRFLQSALFQVPVRSAEATRQLAGRFPEVTARHPVLIERWRKADGRLLIHLVNYADDWNTTGVPVSAQACACTPRSVALHNRGRCGLARLDVYAVIEAET